MYNLFSRIPLHLHQQDIHSQSGRGAHEDDGLTRLDYHVV